MTNKSPENVMSVNTNVEDSLTAIQKERMNAVYHIYGDQSSVIVKLVNGRGIQSWKKLANNALRVNRARGEEAEYYSAVTHTFEVGEIYDVDTISKSVNEERADLGLDPYIKRINTQCVEDFLLVFFVKEEYFQDGDGKSKFRGYRILFKLKV